MNAKQLEDFEKSGMTLDKYLEKQDEQSDGFLRHFRMIAGRIMHMFRHGEVWRHKGWKQLPCNLHFLFSEAISKSEPVTCEYFSLFKYEIIECITLGVKLPWTELTEDQLERLHNFYYPSKTSSKRSYLELLIKNSIEDLCHFLDTLDSDPLTNSDVNIMYTLRALVEHASLIPINESETFEVPKTTLSNFKIIANAVYPTLNYKLDLQKSFRGASCICIVLQHLLASFNKPNVNTMNEWYGKTQVTKPIDVIKFLQQNTSTRFVFKGADPLYIWDADRKKSIKTTLGEAGCISESKDNLSKILDFSKSN
jgi:hypothetical protein